MLKSNWYNVNIFIINAIPIKITRVYEELKKRILNFMRKLKYFRIGNIAKGNNGVLLGGVTGIETGK